MDGCIWNIHTENGKCEKELFTVFDFQPSFRKCLIYFAGAFIINVCNFQQLQKYVYEKRMYKRKVDVKK